MTLHGWIDVAKRSRVAGWAARSDAPETPVELMLCVAPTLRSPAVPIMTTLANGYRADLDLQGTGYLGRAGFTIDLRDFALPKHSFVLDIRDALSGARLPGSPHFIPAAGFDPAPAPQLLLEVDDRPVIRLPPDVAPCIPLQNGTIEVELPAAMAGIMICTKTRIVSGDCRRLGAVLFHVALDGAPVDLDRDGFVLGFHAVEREAGRIWRWLDGAAYLGIGPREAASTVTLELGGLPEPLRPAHDPGPQWQISARYRLARPAV